jgi:Na+-driven multidrug efflux pump
MSSPGTPTRLNAVAGPILGEFLLGMTVSMAGLWLASHTSDESGAAFGLVGQVQEALSVMFRVLAIGLGVQIGQMLGGGQQEAARRCATVALGAGTWVGLVALGWMVFGASWTLDVLNAPDSVSALAEPYMALLGPVMLLDAYNLGMAAILRAHLHVRESLRVMVAMHLTHLALAAVLMRGVGSWEGMGLYGYALAMLVSRALGLTQHLALWRSKLGLRPTRKDWSSVPWALLAPVLRVGVPGAATEMVYRLSFMVSLAATARLGAAALATHSYTLQLLKYVLLVSLAIGWAIEIMVGRLVGAGELAKADRLVRKGVRNGLLASGGMALLFALAAPWLMRAFTRDPQIIAAAQTLLWLSLILETGRVFNLILTGALRATGDVIVPTGAGMVSMAVAMGFGSYLLGRLFGLPGIWLSYALDEWIRGLVLLTRWFRRSWLRSARDTQRNVRHAR